MNFFKTNSIYVKSLIITLPTSPQPLSNDNFSSRYEPKCILLRSICTNLSRKSSQIANLRDTITRMWIGSDPIINRERSRAQPFCKSCNENGHSYRYCSKRKLCEIIDEDDQIFEYLTGWFEHVDSIIIWIVHICQDFIRYFFYILFFRINSILSEFELII